MTTAAQARRSTWLRRTRLATGWIAAAATVATLLIAAVAGSASPQKRVAAPLVAPEPHRVATIVAVGAAHRRTQLRVHHALLRTPVAKRKVRAKAHVSAPAKPSPPPPAPAPPVQPVVVSGGS